MSIIAAFLRGLAAGIQQRKLQKPDYIPTEAERQIAELLADEEETVMGAYLLESRGLVAVQITNEVRPS